LSSGLHPENYNASWFERWAC